ncbi:uncharacterized protein [Typha angustifolia]|uniref:uncharacterized protein isoform X2 n=1 Tax=Typha angustifolia TaxID=59011 RepID=UPI003C306087
MAMTQFAMVEELASLIKDNLYSKHLILSTEEVMVNFLQEDTSVDGILELQPMNPYDRLLSHRLADIFGFAHESVGEGDNRHLVLGRCPETAIPSVLVSDILWQYDEYESPASSHHILRREASALKSMQSLSLSTSLEDREAAYQAARDRIFALHECEEKDVIAPKPRKVPVVARRMIAHALGQKICSSNENISLLKSHNNRTAIELINDGCEENNLHLNREVSERNVVPNGEVISRNRKTFDKPSGQSSNCVNTTSFKKNDGAVDTSMSKASLDENVSNGRVVNNESLQKEQIGAAKRIFAHALGIPTGKGTCDLMVKSEERGRAFRKDM